MAYIQLDEEKRIIAACEEAGVLVDGVEVAELPKGELGDYKYINKKYVYSPTVSQEAINAANIDYIAMMADIELPTEV